MSKDKAVGVHLAIEDVDEMKRRAESMLLSMSNYGLLILKDHLDSGERLVIEEKF